MAGSVKSKWCEKQCQYTVCCYVQKFTPIYTCAQVCTQNFTQTPALSTITATEVQYLSQFTNILLITLYFYPQFFGTYYHRSQIDACNFTCIYCADVVVSDRSRIEKCQSHSNATDCHGIITLSFQSLQGQRDRTRLC